MDICIICFENQEIHNCTILTCGHSFHLECIYKYISSQCSYKFYNINCPLCRKSINKRIFYNIYDIYISEFIKQEKHISDQISYYNRKLSWINIKKYFVKKNYKFIIDEYNENICELYIFLSTLKCIKSKLEKERYFLCLPNSI